MSKSLKNKHSSSKKKGDENSSSEDGCLKILSKGLALKQDETFKDFELKSEYVERDIQISNHAQESSFENPTKTSVIIHKENSVETVDPRDLKDIIKNTKGIKQVIVEKISLKDATRISMLYEPKGSSKLVDNSPSYGIRKIEAFVNKKVLRGREKLLIDSEERVNEEPEFPKTKLEVSENISDDLKTVSYAKHTLTRKKGKNHNGYYYRAEDHMELFKVGSSFLRDFKEGLKNFSFVSCELNEDREKTVFGVASFFNYHTDVKTLIVTANFEKSFYKSFVKNFVTEKRQALDEDLFYSAHVGRGFEVIEYQQLGLIERKLREYDFETFIDDISDGYDLILWDLPALDVLDSNKELYFPLVRSLDNVSFIVAGNVTKITAIEQMMAYFQKYQVKIKGLLYSSSPSEERRTV